MEETTLGPGDFIDIVLRRKWSLILPAVLLVIVGVAVALLLPPVYKSTSTILIKEQEIPEDYVKAGMTSYAEQRIQSINQRVMTTSRLLELIERFDLYRELRNKKTTDELVAKMSEDIRLEPVNVEVADRKTGREKVATIAFNISYEGREPGKVQKVLSTITSLFLSEDLQVREQQAGETVAFLEEEKERVKTRLSEYETVLSSFKEKHIESLPEMFQVNMQGLSTTENAIAREKERLSSLREREGYLETQLVSVEPVLDIEEEKRLEMLEMELANLKSKFSEEYPDVKKLKREIASVRQVVEDKKKSQDGVPDNPVYITLASQLASTKAEILSTREVIKTLTAKSAEWKRKIAATPKVEEEYNTLMADRNNLRAKFNELEQKSMEAKVAMGLQTEQKGERFTLVEPARFPEKPYKPNRMAIVLIGVVLGIGAGVGLASLLEFADSSFRSADALERATGFPVLVDIPRIITRQDRIRTAMARAVVVVVAACVITGGVYAFDTYVMDLEVLVTKIMRRFA